MGNAPSLPAPPPPPLVAETVSLLGQYGAAWVAVCLGWSTLLPASSDPWLMLDTAHTALFKLGTPDVPVTQRTALHVAFHAIFISMLVLSLGRSVLAKWVGCAYLFGAWMVLASLVWLASVDQELADEVALNAADAYTTPWHWLLYALSGQSDLAYPVLAYNFYRGLMALYGYPVAFVPMVQSQLERFAGADALTRLILVFVPLFNYVAVWLVITPRLVRFYEHSTSLWQRATGKEKKP